MIKGIENESSNKKSLPAGKTIGGKERRNTMNDTLKTLMERRSVRSYKPDQIPETCWSRSCWRGEYAPSGMGMQSAVMVCGSGSGNHPHPVAYQRGDHGEPTGIPFYGGPTVVVVLADRRRGTCVEDGSLVMGNLMNAAFSLAWTPAGSTAPARPMRRRKEGASEEMGAFRKTISESATAFSAILISPFLSPSPEKKDFVIAP